MEMMKHRYNQGKDGGVFFYRDSNQNEVDVLLKQEGEITAVEVKSSMTYHPSFEKTLRQLQDWIKTPVTKRAVVYAGEFENNGSDIKLLNYNSLNELL
jgi:predicted AAA+ superfamily ATPase